jgi:hypothetical protein
MLIGFLLIVITSLIILCILKYKSQNTREEFQNSQITPDAKQYQINKGGVEKCDILRVGGSNISSYAAMLNLIDTGRIKKFKPDDTSKLKLGKEYCYIDNDSQNNYQDLMMFGKECTNANSLFATNPMITNVYSDISSDMINSLPLEKCVLEIDPESVNNENLDKFYNMQKDGMSCESKIRKIRDSLNANAAEYMALSNVYKKNVANYDRLIIDESNISKQLQDCTKSLFNNNTSLYSLSNTFSCNVDILSQYNSNALDCYYNTLNAEEMQKTTINYLTNKKINSSLVLSEEVFNHKVCNEAVDKNKIARDKYDKLYRKTFDINNVITSDNAKYNTMYNKCKIDLRNKKIEEAKNKTNAEYCRPYIGKYNICKEEKPICDTENAECTRERVKYKKMSDEKFTLYTECIKKLKQMKIVLNKCLTDVAFFTRDNEVKQETIVVNDKNIDVSSNIYIKCLIDKKKIEEDIKILQQANTDLYNEVEKINRECTKEKTRYISNELDSAKIQLEDKIKKHQEKAKLFCENNSNVSAIEYGECKIGLDQCTNAYVKIVKENCTNSINCSTFAYNEQYCAEQCVADPNCKSIYYNPKEKQCYKFNKPYNDKFIRKPDSNGGYTGNFTPENREKCPQGSINCMKAIGIASDKNIVGKKGETSFDDCTYTCHETSNCYSVSYNKTTGGCTLFNNYYDTKNNENEPIRYNDLDGQTANLDSRYCIPKAWSAWSACKLPEGAKCGLGEKTREKPRGGINCPSAIEKEECFVSCIPNDKTTTWSKCSAKCGNGVRRRYTDSSGQKIEEQACNRNFGIAVFKDDNFRNSSRTYSCSSMRYMPDKDRWTIEVPFGISSYQADVNVASVEFWNKGTMTHSGTGIVKALGDVDVQTFDVIMKPDESTIPFESIVPQTEPIPNINNDDAQTTETPKRIPIIPTKEKTQTTKAPTINAPTTQTPTSTEWSMCSVKCGSGIRRRYTDSSGKNIEEKPCKIGVTVYQDDNYKGKTQYFNCDNMKMVEGNVGGAYPPFGVSSYKFHENVDRIEFWNNGKLTHRGNTDAQALGNVDISGIAIYFKPDQSKIPFESIVPK